jgi:hypothetical protein
MTIQFAVVDAVHEQLLEAVTVKEPEPPLRS